MAAWQTGRYAQFLIPAGGEGSLDEANTGPGPRITARIPRPPLSRPSVKTPVLEQAAAGWDYTLVLGIVAVAVLLLVLAYITMHAASDGAAARMLGPRELAALSKTDQPAQLLSRPVRWLGQVQTVDVEHLTLVISGDTGLASVSVTDELLNGLAKGDRVEVAGTVTGRSRFGSLFIRGTAVTRK